MGRPVDPVRPRALIASAARMFRRYGFERTTVRDIAREAGVQSGSIFYHFASKEDLLVAVMLEGMRQFAAAAAEPLDTAAAPDAPRSGPHSAPVTAPDPRARLRALFLGHLTALHGGGDEQAVVISEWRSLPSASRRRVVRQRDKIEALWIEALEAAAAAGIVRGDLRLLRLAMLGALNWTLQWYRPQGPLSLSELADDLLAVFFAR